MTTSRRGFLKALTQIAVATAAAPALLQVEKLLFVAPAPAVEAVYARITDVHALLQEYFLELLALEPNKRSWLLESVSKGKDWKGGNLVVPFRS